MVKLPVNIASWFVTFEVELPEYIPLDIETKYAKVVGFNKLKIVFENPNEKLTVLITNDIGWNNVSNWDEEVKLTDGVLAYYNRNDVNNIQMISWRKDRVEYAIDYEGKGSIDKHKLIKIASSTK